MIYHGDYATYERVKQALSVMSNVEGDDFIKLIPTFGDFHLQMRWAKVKHIQFEVFGVHVTIFL